MEKETKHWTTSLQEGDFVFATIRHQTDGSKNRHNVKLRVIDVDLKKKQIKGVENGSFYFVTFNELYQSPKQDQRNLEKETEKPFYQFVTKINGSDESGIANITEPSILCICRESDADIIIPALNDYAALKSERDRLEKAFRELVDKTYPDTDYLNNQYARNILLTKAGLKQEGEGISLSINQKVKRNYPESWDYWVSEIKGNEVLIRTTELETDPNYDDFWVNISEFKIN